MTKTEAFIIYKDPNHVSSIIGALQKMCGNAKGLLKIAYRATN